MTTIILDSRTATPHFPGIGRYTSNLARQVPLLLREGEQFVLLVGREEDQKTGRQEDRKIKRYEVDSSPFSLAQQWQVPRQIRDIVRNLHSPLSNLQSLYHSPYYLMPYFPGAPTLLTFYDIIPIAYPEYVAPRARLLYRLTTKLACRAANHIVAISEAARNDLIHHFAVAPDKVTTTPLAPDPRFQPQSQAEIARVRAKYNLPEQFLLYFGINKPHKNLVTLIEACTKLQPTDPLVIAGAWDARYPEAKARAAPLGDAVRFLGRVDDADLPALYAAATIFVQPSRYEGFGLPVLEAMACGTPVACSNTSSLPEVAGDAALLFDPANADAIADALGQLLDNHSLRQQLHEKGINQAARFTWQRTAELTVEQYRRLVR